MKEKELRRIGFARISTYIEAVKSLYLLIFNHVQSAIRQLFRQNRFSMLYRPKRPLINQLAFRAVFVLAVIFGAGYLLQQVANAATANLVPTSTVSSWPGGETFANIDEGPTVTSDAVTTGTGGTTGETAGFGVADLANVSSATSLVLRYCAYSATNANGSTLDTVSAFLAINNVNQSATTVTPPYDTSATNCTWYAVTYTGSWNQAAVDSLEMYFTRTRLGSGGPSNQDDDVRIVSAYVDVTYTQNRTLTQSGYRWFENADSVTAGSPLAAQDTSIVTDTATPFRLRLLIGVSGSSLTTSDALKLQYKWQSSGACTATGLYSDITTTSPIRFYNNATPADAASLGTTGNDPVRSGVTRVNQTYEESNNFAPSSTIAVSEDGMWDFALKAYQTARFDGSYCLRAVDSTGAALNTYSVVPEVGIRAPAGIASGASYRWYQNADSTTPGTSVAAIDAAATFGSAGGTMRLRTGANGIGHFKQISTTSSHTCAIASDNLAYCWGSDSSGELGNGATSGDQVNPVVVNTSGVLSGKTILSISAGSGHTCAIASDNLAYCWGGDTNGQLGNGATSGNQVSPVAVDTSGVLSGKTILSISAGSGHTCAIASDNLAYCWGDDTNGQLGNGATSGNQVSPVAVDTSGVLSGKTILSISAGSGLTCAIASDNKAYCWGSDSSGQLGNGATSGNQVSPVAVDTSGVLSGKTIISISVGFSHTCAIASDNLAYCWGSDSSGQLGNGATSGNQVSPVAVDTSGVLSGKTILIISAAKNSYTCAIASDDQVYCWGGEASGELGNGATSSTQVSPVAVDTSGVLSGKTIISISAGNGHSCAIASDNKAYCWGDDTNGQLGNGSTTGTQVSPVAIDTSAALSGKTISSISASSSHTCVIASDNKAYCWGDDTNGQLGNGSTTGVQVSPVPVDTSFALSGLTILSITTGGSHTCVIASDNLAYCWGRNLNGQLGDAGSPSAQVSPAPVDTTQVLSGKTILSISAGSSHTCAIASDNLAYCWGSDTNGQLGNGATGGDQDSPTAVDTSGVLSGKTILSISARSTSTCAIASDNQAYCWGSDTNGQLGNGATSGNQVSPVAVDTSGVLSGKTISSISVGGHTCAIASDNQAYCWGSDTNGQLGNGATSGNQVSPVAVDTSGVLSGKTIISISAYDGHTCAIASDNQAYCWGTDATGELGNGATSGDQVSPVAVDTSGVLSGKTISSISVGSGLTCAIASDNLAYCWGDDTNGQLGNGATSGNQVSPFAVSRSLLPLSVSIDANKFSFSLQFAQKTAGSCSAQTGFADVTGSSVISYNNNATPANGASITSNANDPFATGISTAQTYHEAIGTILNPNAIASDKIGLWDFSIKDNSAPAGTTYCLRLAGSDGSALGSYSSYPEITTSSSAGPTLDQQLRGGASVLNGVKQNLFW